jgi:hypothetical protein
MFMRPALLTAAALVLATPLYAQAAADNAGQTGTNETSASTMKSTSQADQAKFRQDLSQAGFTDIKIMPESFLVRAKDKAGRPVMMVINPDSFTAVVGAASTGNSQSASSEAAPSQPKK